MDFFLCVSVVLVLLLVGFCLFVGFFVGGGEDVC